MTVTQNTIFLFIITIAFSACSSKSAYSNAKINGVTGWVMEGAQLEDVPPERRPDTLLDPIEKKTGAVGFGFEEKLETPAQAAARKKTVDDLFGR